MAKTLVIYYSRKGQNYVSGSIQTLSKGNTEWAAEYIRGAVGAELFEVETVQPYSEDYTACTEEAKKELHDNARPELQEYLTSIDGYDNIVVAGPCWWGTYPMAVFTQLDRLNFVGKKVFPLMTHEGSGMGNAARDLKKHCPGAEIGIGLAVQGAKVKTSGGVVTEWAKKNLQ